jgi:hypothetical protein
MTLTLSPDEIFELTGKVQPAAQLRWLRKMGIRAYRIDNPDRPVCVCREWLVSRANAQLESTPSLKSDRHGPTAQAR